MVDLYNLILILRHNLNPIREYELLPLCIYYGKQLKLFLKIGKFKLHDVNVKVCV
jgi:hypothetical protein